MSSQKTIQISDKYESLYKSNTRYFILTGGRGCFLEKQQVLTNNGVKSISDIIIGDKVLSYNETKKSNEYKNVLNTFKYSNDKIINIKLKNGTEINVTEDHKFFYNGCWVKIKDLLSLFYGNMESNSKI